MDPLPHEGMFYCVVYGAYQRIRTDIHAHCVGTVYLDYIEDANRMHYRAMFHS